MIFVSTGTQLPFERLVRAVDEWAAESGIEVFGQIGNSTYLPRHFKFVKNMSPSDYMDYFNRADIVVGHVGMGTIISGLENAKPLVLLPRKASLGEHRNDHQLGTAEKFSSHQLIEVVYEESEVGAAIERRLSSLGGLEAVVLEPSPQLIARIRDFVLAD